MKHKNSHFKFNKKTLKVTDVQTKKYFDDYYDKIILNFFESDKIKEESKNNNNENNKIKKNKNQEFSSNSSSRILKICLNGENKINKNNNFDINNYIDLESKERKTENANKKLVTKKLIQSISEKNIYMDNKFSEKKISKSKTNFNMELYSVKKKNEPINGIIKLNLNNQMYKFQNIKDRKNKSLDKRKIRKSKNFGDKINIDLRINVNDVINYKKASYQIKHYVNKNNNKANVNQNLNKRKNKNIKFDKSPENFQINMNNINNLGNNNYAKEKNKNKPKKINTDINSNSKLFYTKKMTKNTENSKNSKQSLIKSKKLIDTKIIKNISLNLSNSKMYSSIKQQPKFKKIKVESVKIDLNSIEPPKNYSFISQEKTTTAENPVLNDKKNLTLRGTEIPKITKIINNSNGYTDLNVVTPNEIFSDLNRSFKTYFGGNKARSLSKKRDEQKRKKINNLVVLNDDEENQKKLNDILISLSNIKVLNTKEFTKKSEPKKLIDKIRKIKKLNNLN